MITEFEQEAIMEDAKQRVAKQLVEVIMQDDKYRGLWNAVFANYVAKTTNHDYAHPMVDKTFDRKQLEHCLEDFFEIIIRTASEDTGRSYSTGQVSEFFGVSIQTIHNWMENGRLSGFEKPQPYKQTKIPDTAIWTTGAGDKLTVREVVSIYEKEQRSRPTYPSTTTEELQAIEHEIKFFSTKYKGSFAETLGHKIKTNVTLSEDERNDADTWSYWLERLERLR